MEIFDSHAHYDAAAFQEDMDAVLSAMPKAGVVGIINAADSVQSAARSVILADTYPFVYAAAGVHPEHAGDVDVQTLADKLTPFLSHPKVVAVGEIGLDYHYDDAAPRAVQKAVFEAQLQLALAHNLPVIVHDRDAHADTWELLRTYRPRGVVHCFSGSVEMMQDIVGIGMYIGLGGVASFPNAKRVRAVAKAVPADRLLLETDAPYMAPVPHRGKRCDSRMIADTAAAIAALRGVDRDTLLTQTAQNVRTLFGI